MIPPTKNEIYVVNTLVDKLKKAESEEDPDKENKLRSQVALILCTLTGRELGLLTSAVAKHRSEPLVEKVWPDIKTWADYTHSTTSQWLKYLSQDLN